MIKLIVAISLLLFIPNYLHCQWLPQDSGTESTLYAVDFLSENQGWIAGEGNKIKNSIDGGQSWVNYSRYTTPGYQIWYSIRFINMDDIYVCGSTYNYDRYQSNWIYSTNGGINWTGQRVWGNEYSRWYNVFSLMNIPVGGSVMMVNGESVPRLPGELEVNGNIYIRLMKGCMRYFLWMKITAGKGEITV